MNIDILLFKSKLFRKFLVWFLLIALIPVIYLSYSSYNNTMRLIEESELKNLISKVEERIYNINTFFLEQKRDIAIQSVNPIIVNIMESMIKSFYKNGLNSAEYYAEEKRITPFLNSVEKKLNLFDILFISPDGDVIYTIEKEADLGTNLLTGPYKDSELAKIFKSSIARKVNNISDFKIYEPSGKPSTFIAEQIVKADQVVGILVFQSDFNVLYELAADYIGLGESGETVIAALEGDYAVVKTPLRHDPSAAFKMKIKMDSEDGLLIQDAVKGNEGAGISFDYRGNEILAAWAYYPLLNWGIVVKIDTEEAFSPAKNLLYRTVLLVIITVILVFFIAMVVSRSIVNPVIEIKQSLGSIAMGEFPVKLDIRSRDEIGEINESMEKVIDSFKKVVSQAEVIGSGNYRADIALRSEKDELGAALKKMTGSLRETKEENKKNNWLNTGHSELDDQMRGEQEIEKLCGKIITFISKYLKSEIGTLYLSNGNGSFQLKASYAYKARKNLSNEFRIGEGLVGQAALEKQSIILKNVPEDYIYVTSGLGEKTPSNILVAPFIFDDKVTGVIEFGSFAELTELQQQFLENILDRIAIAINSAQSRVILADSLRNTQKQAEKLQSQQEELETTNEELRNQTEQLQKSEELLKTQQEELRVSNEELEEKTQFLEAQKQEIAKKNSKLEIIQTGLEEKAKELEITSKYKSEFLANMSHELRTPLNSMLILSQQLAQNKSNNLMKKQVESAEIIHSSSIDLHNLINEILDLSKIEAGKMTLNINDIQITEIANSMNINFKPLLDKKGLKLIINIDADLTKTIRTDKQRLEQVIKNLMSNAIKFTEKGTIILKFNKPPKDVSLSRSGLDTQKSIAISVNDTGIGIPENKQLEIFEAFQQVDGSISRKYGGTGLGLSISRELTNLLGGELQLSSAVGEGSTFTIYLPDALNEPENSEMVVERRTSQRVEYRQAGRKNKPDKKAITVDFDQSSTIKDDRENIKENDKVILVIEDDLNFAKILFKISHENFFKCIHAGDGETGLELVEKFPIDAIILDIRLPGIEGWEVLEALKDNSKTRHIPVHIISGDDVSIEAYKKGAIGYLTKPVDKEKLDRAFVKIEDLISKDLKDLLIVEDDENLRKSIIKLLGNRDIKITATDSGTKAIRELKNKKYDCMILDLSLPDISGFDVLKKIDESKELSHPPVIIYTGKELTHDEEYELNKYADTVIIKGVKSEERLLDETALFLHRVVDDMPLKKKKMISKLHDKEQLFKDKKILLVDDDMRNVFAISQVLEEKGVKVFKVANGKMALDTLESEKKIDLVLMDIMMPVMDGYEAMKNIRKQKRFEDLPILALTAKAMKNDHQKSIAAGANDYLAKPVDVDRLLSLMRVWLYK